MLLCSVLSKLNLLGSVFSSPDCTPCVILWLNLVFLLLLLLHVQQPHTNKPMQDGCARAPLSTRANEVARWRAEPKQCALLPLGALHTRVASSSSAQPPAHEPPHAARKQRRQRRRTRQQQRDDDAACEQRRLLPTDAASLCKPPAGARHDDAARWRCADQRRGKQPQHVAICGACWWCWWHCWRCSDHATTTTAAAAAEEPPNPARCSCASSSGDASPLQVTTAAIVHDTATANSNARWCWRVEQQQQRRRVFLQTPVSNGSCCRCCCSRQCQQGLTGGNTTTTTGSSSSIRTCKPVRAAVLARRQESACRPLLCQCAGQRTGAAGAAGWWWCAAKPNWRPHCRRQQQRHQDRPDDS